MTYLGAAESLAEKWAVAVGIPALLGESKVGHLGDVVVQQDVVDLDVSAKSYKRVRMGKALR